MIREETMARARRRRARPGPGTSWRGRFFEALFRTLDIGVCFLDARLGLVAANPAIRRVRAPKPMTPGRICPERTGGGENPCGTCLCAEALAAGQPVSRETEVPDPAGGVRLLNATCHPLRDGSGRVFGLAEIVRDVTSLGRARRETQLALHDIEMLLGSIRSILVGLDGDNRIRRFNASAEAALGLSAATVTGKDFFAVGDRKSVV
jgi:PAS domain-containing protein